MMHFLEISECSSEITAQLIHRAMTLKHTKTYPSYDQHTVALLFYENSTRTRVSFELAAKNLNMKVIHLDLGHSSETKGETIHDTVQTLAAMGIRFIVLRHKQEGIQKALARQIKNVQFINAGDGTHAHPSQALLDMMTILECKEASTALKIAVVGNIKHSRVARSFQFICQHFNVRDLVLIAPPIWQPQHVHYGRLTDSLEEGLSDADVIMCLRVQNERLADNEQVSLSYYREQFALTQQTLAYAKPDAIILHPGPINRGVELDSDVADSSRAHILDQVTNGVFVRMAILEHLIHSAPPHATT